MLFLTPIFLVANMDLRKENLSKNSDKNTSYQADALMKENAFLSKEKNLRIIRILFCVAMFLCANYIINFVNNIPDMLKNMDSPMIYVGPINLIKFNYRYVWLYLIILACCYGGAWILTYRIKLAYKPLDIGQKGSQRFTSLDEIKAQYKEIDEKRTSFQGKGGFIVARHEDKMYIDDSPVNNLIIGTTRSGKGEMVMFPMIDEYSRAEEQSSLIITDPKLELLAASYDTLMQRNYEVHVLNLIELNYSMFYNPLQIIIEAYKEGDYSQAELLCNTFAYSVFNQNNSSADEKFWANNSSNLLSALILAHIEDCLQADQVLNLERKRMFQEKQGKYVELSVEEQTKISKEIEEENIQGIDLLMLDAIPLECEYVDTHENEKKITMYSIINLFQELASQTILDETNPYYGQTQLDVYFGERPEMNPSKMKYRAVGLAGSRTKGSIFSNFLAELTIFTYEEVAKMTSGNSLNFKRIGYGEKPVAIFIGIPDYDRSKNFLASVFIRQMYFVLAKEATKSRSGKIDREVVFLLDEFGNIPPIESFDSLVTVGLGRNIKFNIVLQSLEQGQKIYKDAWKTIMENCANKMFILSSDDDTAEKFSKLIGKRTFMNPNRSGKRFSTNKTLTEMYEEQPLITANQLMNLKEGENVIIRTIKRTDLTGNSIISYPILNCEEMGTRFKYRYQYMLEDFPQGRLWNELPLERTDQINLKAHVYHVPLNHSTQDMVSNRNEWAQIIQLLKKFYTENEIVELGEKNIYDFLESLSLSKKIPKKSMMFLKQILK